MDLTLTADERAFRDEVRAFARDNLPPAIKRRVDGGLTLAKEDFVTWQKILNKRGWMAPNWPSEHGGTGWSPIQRTIFEETMTLASAPRLVPFGVNMVGPVIIEFGSDAQKQRFLPPILASDEWWCQGYSEPDAGSDLASLRTRAVLDGDAYVVDGTKTWTTLAHYADWMFCLVRTDSTGRKQEGISFLLVDMKSPGLTLTPIRTIDGGQEVNEVFMDAVRVPRENLVGEEGRGWTYAKFLLGHERTGIAGVARSKKQLARLKDIARREMRGGRALMADPRFAAKVAEAEIELMALEYTNLRMVSAENAGAAPGPEASILKLKGTEMQQVLSELLMEAAGYYALPHLPDATADGWNEAPIGPDYAAPLAPHYFNWRKVSIFGGTSEIQKNIIAKMVLGL